MKFLAYRIDPISLNISYEGRDESAGVIGTLTTSQLPIGEAETREGIADVAYASLGRDPTGSIYITDSTNRLLEILSNKRYHSDMQTQVKWHFMAWTLLFFCVVSFIGTLAFGLSWIGVAIFFFIALSYVGLVQLGFQNEVESAVLCTMILLLIFLLVPAMKHVVRAAQQPQTLITTS